MLIAYLLTVTTQRTMHPMNEVRKIVDNKHKNDHVRNTKSKR